MEAEESDADRVIDDSEEIDVPGSPPVSHYIPAAIPSFHHTPITGHHTPREHDCSMHCTHQSDSDPFDKVLVSYLLRHFKQGPGQWYVLMTFKFKLKQVLTMTKDGSFRYHVILFVKSACNCHLKTFIKISSLCSLCKEFTTCLSKYDPSWYKLQFCS